MKYKSGITEITDIKSEKGWGCLGITLGVVGGIFYVIVGILLCFTGIGAIIGIPLIIGALLMMFAGVSSGDIRFKGVCPYCGKNIERSKGQAFDCIFCKERILLEGNKLYTKETFSERNKAITDNENQ